MSESKSFFTTLPGILSGTAALITAVAGLLIAIPKACAPRTEVAPGATAEPSEASATALPPVAASSPATGSASAFSDPTDGWAIIGKARRGRFFDLDLFVEGDTPAIGKRYKVVNDFRLISRGPQEPGAGQTITLGMVHRGDEVEVLDLFIPAPSTETVPVHARLRADLHPVRPAR